MGGNVLRSLAPAQGGESEPSTFGQLVASPRGDMVSKVEQGDAEKSSLGLPQREKVRPTIWQALAPLAPAIAVERTGTAQGPEAMGTEVRGVGSRKRDGSTGRTSGVDEKRVRFEQSARIIPDAWFTMLSKAARFPSREAEERLRDKLLGHTIPEVAFGVENAKPTMRRSQKRARRGGASQRATESKRERGRSKIRPLPR